MVRDQRVVVEIIAKRGHRLERFDADVVPEDEIACTALLRRRARELRRPAAELVLRVWPHGDARRRREYRA